MTEFVTARKAMRAALIALGLLALALTVPNVAAPAFAQDGGDLPPGVTWDEVNQVAHQMYCDVCEGIPLDECESIACRQWRDEIARQLGDGRTEDEIIDYFAERYGAEVAALPRDPADRLIAFAVPAVLVVLFGVVGAWQVRRLRQQGVQAGQVVRRSGPGVQARPVPDDVDMDYLDRLNQELEGLES